MNSQSLLDEMVNEDSVRILKAAIPYLPSKGQSLSAFLQNFWNCKTPLSFYILLKMLCRSAPSLRKRPIPWKCSLPAVKYATDH